MASGLSYKIITTILFVSFSIGCLPAVSAEELFEFFDGRIGEGTSSWFEADRWTGIGRVPTLADSVRIDEANTYAAIDDKSSTAKVLELVVGRSAASDVLGSVQLDLLKKTKLSVKKHLTIGQLKGSDGSVYAQDGSVINVGRNLIVGFKGNGLLVLSGSAEITARTLVVGRNSRIIMSDEAKIKLNGDKRNAVKKMISKGLIVTETGGSIVVNRKSGKTTVAVKVESDEEPTPEPTRELSCDNRKLKFQNKKKRNCAWVEKQKKRCKKKWKNERLSDWCPQSCKDECKVSSAWNSLLVGRENVRPITLPLPNGLS